MIRAVLTRLKKAGLCLLQALERLIGHSFSGFSNPFYSLGALAFYFFYIIVGTGIYLFIFYEPSIKGSFDSVHYLTHDQWYFGGIMRSLHRYSSDALVLIMVLHILREFVLDRYRGARWFTWVTGFPALVLIFISGLVGYWLVWDTLGQYIAVRSTEWLDWLPIFSEPSARNFLTNSSVSDLFFRLILIGHIAISIFLFVALMVHVKNISKAITNPPQNLAVGTFLCLLILSLVLPAVSQERADLSQVPGVINIDWFYMFAYPLMDRWSMGGVWALVVVITLLLLLLPWLPPQRHRPVAKVLLEKCSGCNLCVMDCPYEAIILQPRTDGHPSYAREAVVVADNCVGCGICTGACPFSRPPRGEELLTTGIDIPSRDIQHLYRASTLALEALNSNAASSSKVLVYGCDHGAALGNLDIQDIAVVSLPCTAALPVSFIGYMLRHGADGVFLTGCRKGDCYYRLGNIWIEQRLSLDDHSRPHLPRWISRERVGYCWAGSGDERHLTRAIDRFQKGLHAASAVVNSDSGQKDDSHF
ncbi:hypothetical protein MNBD_GAMMA20-2124 [hydrothermal vent metagenome]|uniref:Hydrogenase iron-sulfur subunit n=1 Tax=hydrothermal vent metagenome TaxID=652676 RepID=A0A3B1BGV0_9ZZZZ